VAINAIDIEPIVELWDRGAHASARSTLSRIEAVLATAIARKWCKTANVVAWKVFKHVAPKRLGGDDEDRRHATVSWQDRLLWSRSFAPSTRWGLARSGSAS
jgi:hypothetical protein